MDYTFTIDIYWLIMYAVGTLFGYWIARTMPREDVVESTIDYLIEHNLVRWREDENGDIEILPIEEEK